MTTYWHIQASGIDESRDEVALPVEFGNRSQLVGVEPAIDTHAVDRLRDAPAPPINRVGDHIAIRQRHPNQVAQRVVFVRCYQHADGLRRQFASLPIGVGGIAVRQQAILVVIGRNQLAIHVRPIAVGVVPVGYALPCRNSRDPGESTRTVVPVVQGSLETVDHFGPLRDPPERIPCVLHAEDIRGADTRRLPA